MNNRSSLSFFPLLSFSPMFDDHNGPSRTSGIVYIEQTWYEWTAAINSGAINEITVHEWAHPATHCESEQRQTIQLNGSCPRRLCYLITINYGWASAILHKNHCATWQPALFGDITTNWYNELTHSFTLTIFSFYYYSMSSSLLFSTLFGLLVFTSTAQFR